MKTSLEVNEEVWRRARVLAAARGKSLSEAVDDALQEWIARGRAELEGIAEWVRRPIRSAREEAESAKAVCTAQDRAYSREQAELTAARRRTSRKGGKR